MTTTIILKINKINKKNLALPPQGDFCFLPHEHEQNIIHITIKKISTIKNIKNMKILGKYFLINPNFFS